MIQARRLGCAIGALALIALCAGNAGAVDDPDLVYWTIETEHFRIHYPKNIEPLAERLARLSEAIHDRLVGPLGYSPSGKTEVALTDVTDNANGSATALPYNTIRLFVTAPDDLSPLADYDDWQLGLMTHEYTHILHVDNVSGVPSVVNAVLGKTLIPNQVQPRWIIEGLATVMESAYSSGGRIRSSLFDMYIRADVLEDNVVRLDQLSSDARRWPQGTLYYLYGSRFLHWIAGIYGQDVLRAVSTDYGASLVPWGINRAIRRQTGRTYVELWEGFVADLRRRYARQMKTVEARGLREGQRLTFHGREVAYPTFVPAAARRGKGRELVYFREDFHEKQGIYRIDLTTDDEELVARTTATTLATFTPEGDMLFSSVVPFKQIYARTDLFRIPRGKTAPDGWEPHRRRLTRGLRANAPAASPDGRHLAFITNDRGTTTLKIADLNDDGGLERVRTLVPSKPFDQAFTPTFSPDGRTIAYSVWTAGGFRDLRLVDVATGRIEQLTHDRALDQNPTFSPDGKTLFFSSDRTGIFNIYALDLESRKLKQVTNVRTGALMPAVSEDGKLLAYVGYTSQGYDLFVMPLDPERYLEAREVVRERPAPYPEPPPVKMDKRPYSPWSTLRPRNYFFEYAPGNFGANALTLTVDSTDIIGRHAISGRLVADPNAPLPQASVAYRYGRLPFDMSIELSNRLTPRTDFRFNNQRVEYIEKSYNLRTGLSYTHPGEFSRQTIGVSYTASLLDSELPLGEASAIDPYASPTIEPLRGMLSVARVAYSVSNVDGSFDAAGPARGMSLSLGLDIGDDFLGSQDSIYQATYRAQAYIAMPWPGAHTLALRSGGGLATGSFARRGVFFVGGLNLENTSPLDQLTSGVFNGAFVLRGYPPAAFSGSAFLLNNLEYRVPLAYPDRGLSTVPIFLRRVDLNLFVDHGGAFDKLDFDAIRWFHNGAILDSPDLHTAAGAELWLGTTLGYVAGFNFRLGYAWGFSPQRVPGGQWYFIASSAF